MIHAGQILGCYRISHKDDDINVVVPPASQSACVNCSWLVVRAILTRVLPLMGLSVLSFRGQTADVTRH